MNPSQPQQQLIKHLTQYLKHFKAKINAEICLLEALFTDEDMVFRLMEKLKEKSYQLEIEEKLSQARIVEGNWKQVQRLYLRINEYLEYRLLRMKQKCGQAIHPEIQDFQNTLQRIFSSIGQQVKKNSQALTLLFKRIEQNEEAFFKKVIKKAPSTSLDPKNVLSVMKGKFWNFNSDFLSHQIPTFQSSLSQYHHSVKPSLLELKSPLSSHTHENMKKKEPHFQLNIRVRRSTIESSLPYSNSFHVPPVRKIQNPYFSSPLQLSQNQSQDTSYYSYLISRKEKQEKKLQFKVRDIMELQQTAPESSNDGVYDKLIGLNKKNIAMISQFKKRHMKKMKKQLSITQESTLPEKRASTIQQAPKKKTKYSMLPSIHKFSK